MSIELCAPRIYRSLSILLLTLLIIPLPVYVYSQDSNINSSYKIIIYVSGYDGVSPITAYLFDTSYSILINETFTSDMIELVINSSGEYIVAIVYKKVPYVKSISVSDPITTVNFTVYDVVKGDSTISIPVHHIIIAPQGSYIQVMEVVFFKNIGDKVVINGTEIKMFLPEEYIKFNSDVMSCCLENTDWGFIFKLMDNLLPGEAYRITYTYEIPVSSDDYYFEIPVSYFTEYVLIAIKEGYEINELLNLVYKGQISVEDGNYVLYEGYNITKDMKVGLLIKGVGGGNIWVLSVIILVTSVSIVTLSFWSVFKRKPSLEELEKEKDELMGIMGELENKFKNGELDEEEYLRLRIKYKRKIIKLMKKIDRLKGDVGGEGE